MQILHYGERVSIPRTICIDCLLMTLIVRKKNAFCSLRNYSEAITLFKYFLLLSYLLLTYSVVQPFTPKKNTNKFSDSRKKTHVEINAYEQYLQTEAMSWFRFFHSKHILFRKTWLVSLTQLNGNATNCRCYRQAPSGHYLLFRST